MIIKTFAAAKVQKKNEMRKFFYIIVCIFLLGMTSCEQSSRTSTQKSSVAELTSFTFAKNDTIPGLAKAVFTIEDRIDTGFVWNKDSMLYGTSLKRVVPKFTFAATPGAAYLTTPDTVMLLTGYDTLDFSKEPIYLNVRSQDAKTIKVYQIHPTVHQSDPDLYVWDVLNEGVYPNDDSEQKVMLLGGNFLMISSNGYEIDLYSSANGEDWSPLSAPTGLPIGTKVRQMISDGETLYYGQDSSVYTSDDAITWTEHKTNYPVRTMLMYWNEEIWLLIEQKEQYEIATFDGDSVELRNLLIDGEFPISDFATVSFFNASGRERAMIIGGFAENGKSLNTRWNFEYSHHIKENGGYRIQEFSIDRPKFTSLTGISTVYYNDQLLLFGGVDSSMNYFGRDIMVSNNEGLTWTAADSTKNQLPEAYQARQKQSAIAVDDYIYLFGGQDRTRTYSDVYRGKLNSINWIKK